MNHPEEDNGVLNFDFSVCEGHELATLLEHLLFSAADGIDMNILETVYERLCDENYLAVWKREHVSLDLSMTELIELNKALRHAGGSALANKFELTGELRCCLITAPGVDRMYTAASGT